MSPPITLPRLGDVDATLFAADVLAMIAMRGAELSDLAGFEPGRQRPAPSFEMAKLVAEWARAGGDTETAKAAIAALEKLVDALYRRPIDSLPDTSARGSAGEAHEPNEVRTIVGLVLTAAAGRSRLMRGESITLKQLAALASMSKQRIGQFILSGELKRVDRASIAGRKMDAPVTRGSAIKWLASRGVPGFEHRTISPPSGELKGAAS